MEDTTMAVVKWNSARNEAAWPSDLFGLQREMNTMFDRLFRGTDDAETTFSAWCPATDIAEQDDAYIVHVEVPGVKKEDFKITLESNILTIRGEKKQEKESKNDHLHRVERSYGSFQRSFTLPAKVKNDKIEAVYKDGVVTLTLPKAEETKPKQIEVKIQ
jgi:HSP20 family protein